MTNISAPTEILEASLAKAPPPGSPEIWKQCRVCGENKPATEFWAGKAQCKPCYRLEYTKGRVTKREKFKQELIDTFIQGDAEPLTMVSFTLGWIEYYGGLKAIQADVATAFKEILSDPSASKRLKLDAAKELRQHIKECDEQRGKALNIRGMSPEDLDYLIDLMAAERAARHGPGALEEVATARGYRLVKAEPETTEPPAPEALRAG